MGRLTGKRVLITGTGGGQGEAAQRLFAEEGAAVVGCDLKEGTAEESAARLRREGHEVHGRTVDLSVPEAAQEWVDSGVAMLGGVDVLYNNAAGFAFAPFSEMKIELFRHVLRVELEIVFNTTSPVWKFMSESGGGSIINTGSVSALRGNSSSGLAAHAAAKGGVVAMSIALAAEGAEHGIRVNTISPGVVVSPATQDSIDGSAGDWARARTLLPRLGKPMDVALLALYLAADESSWTTGQNFVVDGGMSSGWRKR